RVLQPGLHRRLLGPELAAVVAHAAHPGSHFVALRSITRLSQPSSSRPLRSAWSRDDGMLFSVLADRRSQTASSDSGNVGCANSATPCSLDHCSRTSSGVRKQ